MGVFKNFKAELDAKDIMEVVSPWKNKQIGLIDQTEPWVNITLGRKEWLDDDKKPVLDKETGKPIVFHNILFHYADKKIAVPVSREFDVDTLKQPGALQQVKIYITKQRGKDDTEGDYDNYTGPDYVCAGKPGKKDYGTEVSLIDVEMVETKLV